MAEQLPWSQQRAARPDVVASADGAIAFRLEKGAAGLCVRRERLKLNPHVRLQQTALFVDSLAFKRWLDRDDIRFDYPMVHLTVQKVGMALLEG